MNVHTCKSLNDILNDVRIKSNGEINTTYITTLKLYFDTILDEGLKHIPQLFYHQRM